MSTRCTISIIDRFGREYKIYRHTDGEPERILHDLKLVLENFEYSIYEHPETFLACFIFYERFSYLLRFLKEQKSWMYKWWESPSLSELCSPLCEHGDLAYKYTLYFDDERELRIRIEERNYEKEGSVFDTIFDGDIDEAFERFDLKQSHILPEVFENSILLFMR